MTEIHSDVDTLKQRFKYTVKWFIPFGIVEFLNKKIFGPQYLARELTNRIQAEAKWTEKELEIENYFRNMDQSNLDQEIVDIIDYFEKNDIFLVPGAMPAPYDFVKKYHSSGIKVYQDIESCMNYVLHDGKRLYFPKAADRNSVRNTYNALCIEQDIDSPHRYETLEYSVKNGDTIMDIGAAEGLWGLDSVEKAGQIYLFECNPNWIEALEKTFEPWKEKVCIVNKYISDVSDEKNITLDDFLKGETVNFIKTDIEGMEFQLLKGAQKTLCEATDLKLVVCTYHRQDDAEHFRSYLEAMSFVCEYSKGYLLSIWGEEPYLRRGLIRATKSVRR